jgi:hypothetical protein
VAEWITARAAELSNLSVFADCFPADLYPLAALLEPLRAGDGEVLMRQGDGALVPDHRHRQRARRARQHRRPDPA